MQFVTIFPEKSRQIWFNPSLPRAHAWAVGCHPSGIQI